MNTKVQTIECASCGEQAGYCERHRMHKPLAWVRLCKTRPDYRQAWDEGRGPGQEAPGREASTSEATSGETARRQSLRARIEERLREISEHRSEAEIEAILDACQKRGAWPCRCGNGIAAWVDDVARPDRWRPEWGPKPQAPSEGPVMSTDEEQPDLSMPPLYQQAWNLAQSLTAFVADGCKTVTADQYRQRLEICDGCDRRRGNRCAACGCRLSLKARGRAFRCPLSKWPEV